MRLSLWLKRWGFEVDKIKREPDTTFAEDLDKWARRIASETNFATGGYVSKGQLQDIIGGDLHFGHLVSKEEADIMRAHAERHRCPPNSVRVVNVKVTVDDDGRASAHIVRHNRLSRIAPKVRRQKAVDGLTKSHHQSA